MRRISFHIIFFLDFISSSETLSYQILTLCDEFVPADPPEYFFDRSSSYFPCYLSFIIFPQAISIHYNSDPILCFLTSYSDFTIFLKYEWKRSTINSTFTFFLGPCNFSWNRNPVFSKDWESSNPGCTWLHNTNLAETASQINPEKNPCLQFILLLFKYWDQICRTMKSASNLKVKLAQPISLTSSPL